MIVAYERRSGRSARKREAILQAATELFLIHEYAGTSMEDIAVAAAVSKQTVYKHFSDKQTCFGRSHSAVWNMSAGTSRLRSPRLQMLLMCKQHSGI